MREFERFPARTLLFRLFLILAGALTLLAAFAPSAKADLIAYLNFEGTADPPYPVNMTSSSLGFVQGVDLITNYNPANLNAESPGLPENWQGDVPNNFALGMARTFANSPATFDMQLFSPQGFFQDMTLTFAVNVAGNGFSAVNLYYSTTGIGGPFTLFHSQALPAGGTVTVSAAVPAAANNAPLLVLRMEFVGGQSNGNNSQDILDNITVTGTIVPEPATVAGGLLGVLGLCWFQRRRLIGSVRFRRT